MHRFQWLALVCAVAHVAVCATQPAGADVTNPAGEIISYRHLLDSGSIRGGLEYQLLFDTHDLNFIVSRDLLGKRLPESRLPLSAIAGTGNIQASSAEIRAQRLRGYLSREFKIGLTEKRSREVLEQAAQLSDTDFPDRKYKHCAWIQEGSSYRAPLVEGRAYPVCAGQGGVDCSMADPVLGRSWNERIEQASCFPAQLVASAKLIAEKGGEYVAPPCDARECTIKTRERKSSAKAFQVLKPQIEVGEPIHIGTFEEPSKARRLPAGR